MKKTGNSGLVLLLLLFSLLLQHCTHQPVNRKGFLPPVKIRIPREARNNPATVAFVKSSEALINTLSDKVEYLAVQGKALLNKNTDDLSVIDKIKLAKVNVEMLSAGNSLIEKMDKIQEYVKKKEKEGVSRNDLKAYEAVEKAIEKRINQLNKKYKKLMN